MNKKIYIILALLVLAIAGGYYWWANYSKLAPSATEQASADLQKTVETAVQDSAVKGVLPNIDTSAAIDAAANVPDTNPYSNTNPFSNVKVNPFE